VDNILPGATEVGFKYFRAMLDVDGDGKVTYEELRHCIRNCVSAGTYLGEMTCPVGELTCPVGDSTCPVGG
jgi:hypothetical protein